MIWKKQIFTWNNWYSDEGNLDPKRLYIYIDITPSNLNWYLTKRQNDIYLVNLNPVWVIFILFRAAAKNDKNNNNNQHKTKPVEVIISKQYDAKKPKKTIDVGYVQKDTKHDWVVKVVHRELCKKLKFDHTNKCNILALLAKMN